MAKNPTSKTTLDFGRRFDAALDAIEEVLDAPAHEIQHDIGRVVFYAPADDPRMVEVYEHLRRRGVTWLGPGRERNGGASLVEQLKNAY